MDAGAATAKIIKEVKIIQVRYIFIACCKPVDDWLNAQSITFKGESMSIQYGSFNASGAPVLPPNQKMTPGQFLQSSNERFRLELQGDGNLVIKDNGAIVRVAGSGQAFSVTLSRKQRGAPWVVVSNNGFLHDPARSRLWIAESSHAKDKSRWYHSHMSMQNDGDLVIYDGRNGDILWAHFGFTPGRIKKPTQINVNGAHNKKDVYTWHF